jgi:formylglycine-generating enzyme required for sulfatase activity
MESLRPVRTKLFPQLSAIYRDVSRRDVERSLAADILADYAADQPQLLADLLMDADEKQFAVIYPKLKEQGEQGLPVLIGEIDKKLPSDLPSSDEGREKLAKRQANAAVALLKMNQPPRVYPLLKHSPDPRVRSYLIHRLSPLEADAGALIQHLGEEPDITIRRALLLSLGEFDAKEFSPEGRQAALPKLQEMYRTATDPGLHAAAEWLLRQWHEETWLQQMGQVLVKDKEQREKCLADIKQVLAKDKDEAKPQWYVTGQGLTMVVISGPVEFLMGSPPTEVGREEGADGEMEKQHKKRIGHSFAIAAKKVTVEQFLRFRKDHKYNKQFAPKVDCPVNLVTWYEAAAYCNWLSAQEGLPEGEWCYLPIGYLAPAARGASAALLGASPLGIGSVAAMGTLMARDQGLFASGMRCAPNYLHRTGYRLPTEAEWEYACRAGAMTSRYYGDTETLLGRYAWYTNNSFNRWMVSVGSLKPNDFGLFDMHDNANEWCHDMFALYSPGSGGRYSEDLEDKRDVNDSFNRILRGGSFRSHPVDVRCADRGWNTPAHKYYDVGFRPVRTFR